MAKRKETKDNKKQGKNTKGGSGLEPSAYDILGSYTGIAADGGRPEQDPDDL